MGQQTRGDQCFRETTATLLLSTKRKVLFKRDNHLVFYLVYLNKEGPGRRRGRGIASFPLLTNVFQTGHKEGCSPRSRHRELSIVVRYVPNQAQRWLAAPSPDTVRNTPSSSIQTLPSF